MEVYWALIFIQVTFEFDISHSPFYSNNMGRIWNKFSAEWKMADVFNLQSLMIIAIDLSPLL